MAQCICKAIEDIVWDIWKGIRFSNVWWFRKEQNVNTMRVFGFVCYVSYESKQAYFRMSHIPLQTMEIASSSKMFIPRIISRHYKYKI